ncbi:alpha-tocopherol transfer protein-like [Battus philenor]|uniref:alpha-tocopherol transfer protein-like n=1 Tax=Battus philenor TaxID=42288 RepID=UPI0035CFA3FE
MAFLEGPSPKQAEIIKQELGEGTGDLERGVRDLQSMCAASPYLPQPEIVDTNILELFVRGCRMDQERARKKFEAFCIGRARSRDLYEFRSISEPPLSNVLKFLDIAPLPKLTDEGHRVTIFRVRPNYPEGFSDIAAVVRAILLVSDARMHDETLIAGDIFIWEGSNIRSSFVARIAAAANAVRRAIHLAHAAYPQRLRQIHVVGAPPLMASSLNFIRSCVNEKIRNRYYFHQKVEDLYEHLPVRILPAEWGGEEVSFDVIMKKWTQRVDELRDFLQDLSELSNVTEEPQLDSDIYGTVGAFRKLEID